MKDMKIPIPSTENEQVPVPILPLQDPLTCILIFTDSTQVFGIVSVQCYGCGPRAAGNVLSGPSLEKVAHP